MEREITSRRKLEIPIWENKNSQKTPGAVRSGPRASLIHLYRETNCSRQRLLSMMNTAASFPT